MPADAKGAKLLVGAAWDAVADSDALPDKFRRHVLPKREQKGRPSGSVPITVSRDVRVSCNADVRVAGVTASLTDV